MATSKAGIKSIGNHKKWLFIFMIGWFIINALQACFLGLDGDEAYYWMLSQNLSWGYFDHPPMVTVLIQLGENLEHGAFFTRLGTVTITTLSIAVIYAALPEHLKNIKYFLWLFAATLLFNVYSFITTPDAPLLFFSAVFFYSYKWYLQKDSITNTILMALAVAGMFYSKYHGILPVFFVVLSNLKLLTRVSFWGIVLMVTLLFLPHLYWQYIHDWPTVKFHLFERATKKYKIEYTTNYLLGQLLVWGPVISLFFYYTLRSIKITDKLLKAHLFNFSGILILFFLSSFRNNVQPHWTLVAGCSFVVLYMQLLHDGSQKFSNTFLKLCYMNIALIIIARVLFLLPNSPMANIKNYKPFFEAKAWADSIYKLADGKPVLFTNSYTAPSLYQFYHTDATTTGYNTKYYRKTHYTINNKENELNAKDIFWFREGEPADSLPKVITDYKNGNLVAIENFTAINHLKIKALNLPQKIKANSNTTANLIIENTGIDTIINTKGLLIEYSYSPLSYVVNDGVGTVPFHEIYMPPGYKKIIPIVITAPPDAGNNRILFSFKNGILDGNFASPYYKIHVVK